jgi:hypothetical protein
MKSPVIFVDGQEAGRLLDVEEPTHAYQFPKTLEPLSVLSFWDPATDPVRDTVVHYRIGTFRGTWGRFPIRVGWSSQEINPADDTLRQYVTHGVLKVFADFERERPLEIVNPGSHWTFSCSPALVAQDQSHVFWGQCAGCSWETAKTYDLGKVDKACKAHMDDVMRGVQEWRETRPVDPDFDEARNEAEIRAGLDAISALLNEWEA